MSVGTGFGVIGDAISSFGSLMAGKSQSKALQDQAREVLRVSEDNAKKLEKEAEFVGDMTDLELEQFDFDMEQVRGGNAVLAAKAGASFSSFDIVAQNARLAEKQRDLIKLVSSREITKLNEQAKATREAGWFEAGSLVKQGKAVSDAAHFKFMGDVFKMGAGAIGGGSPAPGIVSLQSIAKIPTAGNSFQSAISSGYQRMSMTRR